MNQIDRYSFLIENKLSNSSSTSTSSDSNLENIPPSHQPELGFPFASPYATQASNSDSADSTSTQKTTRKTTKSTRKRAKRRTFLRDACSTKIIQKREFARKLLEKPQVAIEKDLDKLGYKELRVTASFSKWEEKISCRDTYPSDTSFLDFKIEIYCSASAI